MSTRAIGRLGMLAIMSGVFSAPTHAQHGATGGEWPTYGGDLGHTRYAALDQIDADNFSELELGVAVPHREPRTRPRVRLPVDPVDGRRRALHHGRHAPGRGGRRCGDGASCCGCTGSTRARGARRAPRRLSGRGLTYWDDGGDGVIFYVTPGYRLIALNARTGRRAANFGENGLVDLKQGLDQDLDPP